MGYWSDRSIDGEENWEERQEWAKQDAHCGRCNDPISLDEKEFYEENGVCSFCAQMMRHGD